MTCLPECLIDLVMVAALRYGLGTVALVLPLVGAIFSEFGSILQAENIAMREGAPLKMLEPDDALSIFASLVGEQVLLC